MLGQVYPEELQSAENQVYPEEPQPMEKVSGAQGKDPCWDRGRVWGAAGEPSQTDPSTAPPSTLSMQGIQSILGNTDLTHLLNAILPEHFCGQDTFFCSIRK